VFAQDALKGHVPAGKAELAPQALSAETVQLAAHRHHPIGLCNFEWTGARPAEALLATFLPCVSYGCNYSWTVTMVVRKARAVILISCQRAYITVRRQ